MERVLKGLKPENVFYYLEEVLRIPRESHHEGKISNYLVSFAKKRNLKVTQDEHYNVIIEKPATPGYENSKKIILQGHMDMVCVKNPEVEFDFSKDPIDIYIDGEYLKARGTSLGADDGNALALCLAILDSKDLKHPALQVIFTTAEEVGLEGAQKLDASLIDGDYLIGLDYSHDDKILVSCAGSNRNNIIINIKNKKIQDKENKNSMEIKISGLKSGHSGNEIQRCRANAIKLMGGILSRLDESFDIDLVAFQGGDKINVIPAFSSSQICYSKKDEKSIIALLNSIIESLIKEFSKTDPDMKINFSIKDALETCYEDSVKHAVLDVLDLIPNGVNTFSDVEKSIPESSLNLGMVYVENERLYIASMIRSNYDFEQDELIRRMKKIAKMAGADFNVNNRSSSWEYNPKSRLKEKISQIYEKLNKQKPEIHQLHAGVETGMLVGKIKETGRNIDAVNLGVKNLDVHTTKERMFIPSLAKTYGLLVEILKSLE